MTPDTLSKIHDLLSKGVSQPDIAKATGTPADRIAVIALEKKVYLLEQYRAGTTNWERVTDRQISAVHERLKDIERSRPALLHRITYILAIIACLTITAAGIVVMWPEIVLHLSQHPPVSN